MILLIDNYDSFTYNLYQMIGSLDPDIKVIRNDELSVEQIAALHPSHIVISPGPGKCEDAGVCIETVRTLGPTIPILGVCLGHQAICVAFGATVTHAPRLMHGKQSQVAVDRSCTLFKGLGPSLAAARYHSLAAVEATIPPCLRVTATSDDGQVMAVQHETYPIFGLQFHPESIMTPDGARMLEQFLQTGERR
jgi:anthranilate synthase component 2